MTNRKRIDLSNRTPQEPEIPGWAIGVAAGILLIGLLTVAIPTLWALSWLLHNWPG